jgi:putative addiction module component (TIGR02574 family)
MASTAEKLAAEALKLSVNEKLVLIDLLTESVEAPTPPVLTPDQIAELERREKLYQEDPSRAIPWEQAHAEIREHLALLRTERERLGSSTC